MSANDMSELQAVAESIPDQRISAAARDGFDTLLQQALRSSLVPSAASAEITVLDDVAAIVEKKMVVLTISSYLFRLMVMFHFTPDAATRGHFARLTRANPAEMGDQAFMDAIAECGNLCCGIFNRELGRFFPHLGMSTPNVIDTQCVAYLQKLNCAHVRHFAIDLADAPRFHVSLCISAYDHLDFAVSVEEQVDTTGELELF
ncbi:hypothetical protein [Herbaspirillum rubrisubalbicans]|uniref:Chemotaxis protein CheX n=1 Tax=Herbaspirillum rubrisubalbicans Os34 TaxID=1235827 RepID=A0A6M3ZSM0_9BURK|nr:hypothetical protein [Herbaspirillum rubrisubalbicans]QJQ00980.1 hypothetical protein C798_12265 [Herbaspirillum rubrisubalbicans Os34]